jgi:maintenance of morphology protein 1
MTSEGKGKAKVERDLREEARREVEADMRAEREKVEADGLRWRKRAKSQGQDDYSMPGSLPEVAFG